MSTSTGYKAGWNDAVERCAEEGRHWFIGMFTGWHGKTGESKITLDEAEDHASLCGQEYAAAIRKLLAE